MSDLRLSKFWDREVEEGFPDCRLKYGNRHQVTLGSVPVEAVYCHGCGEIAGFCTAWTPHIYFVCDRCVGRIGAPPEMKEVDKKWMAERGIVVRPV